MEHFFLEGEELKNYNYIIMCHNLMLSLIKRANRHDWHSFKIDIKEEHKEVWEKHDIEYWRLQGYKKEISRMYYQHTFFSLWSKEINNFKENKEILKMWYLYCPHCRKKIYLDRFVFYNCHKENEEYIKGRYKSKKVK